MLLFKNYIHYRKCREYYNYYCTTIIMRKYLLSIKYIVYMYGMYLYMFVNRDTETLFYLDIFVLILFLKFFFHHKIAKKKLNLLNFVMVRVRVKLSFHITGE